MRGEVIPYNTNRALLTSDMIHVWLARVAPASRQHMSRGLLVVEPSKIIFLT